MKKMIKYNKSKTYITPSGAIYDFDTVIKNHPGVEHATHIIETDDSETMIFSISPLAALKNVYALEDGLSEEETIIAAQEKINTPHPDVQHIPDATERLAAAQEYDNLQKYGAVSAGVIALNVDNGLWSKSMAQEALTKVSRNLTDEEILALAPIAKPISEVIGIDLIPGQVIVSDEGDVFITEREIHKFTSIDDLKLVSSEKTVSSK